MARALVETAAAGRSWPAVGARSCFLRRLAFVADAMTHTVFPGVVVGFLAGGRAVSSPGRSSPASLTRGAADRAQPVPAGHRRRRPGRSCSPRCSRSASSSCRGAPRTPSDLTAFLFGRLLTVDARPSSCRPPSVAAVVLAVLGALSKELLLRAFDPAGRGRLGYRIGRLDLVLNLVIALVVVAAVQRGRHAAGDRAAGRAGRDRAPAVRRACCRWPSSARSPTAARRLSRAASSATRPPSTTASASPAAPTVVLVLVAAVLRCALSA